MIVVYIMKKHYCLLFPLLVSLITPLVFSDLIKRSASSELRYFDCPSISNPDCTEEVCTWVCRNPISNEHCRVATLKHGVNTYNQGQHIFCNHEGGCESVVCPDSCVNNPLACSCVGAYQLNDLVVVQPRDCLSVINNNVHSSSETTSTIDYETYATISTTTNIAMSGNDGSFNENSNSNALTIGLSIGIPIVVATFVVTTAVLLILYSRHKSNTANLQPYSHLNDD